MHHHIESEIRSNFEDEEEVIEYVLRDPLLFGDYRNACNEEEPRYYEDLLDYEAIYSLLMEVEFISSLIAFCSNSKIINKF